jgi:hypothetical protein
MLNHGSKYSELPDHQYALIGKVIVEFSNIDLMLDILLTRLLLSPDFLGRSYTDQLSVPKTIEAIKQALDVHRQRYNNNFISEEKAGDIRLMLTKVKEVQTIRNKFAHRAITRSGNNIALVRFSGKPPNDRGETSDFETINEESLNNLYKNAYKIVDTLRAIVETIVEVKEEFIVKEMIHQSMIAQNTTDPSAQHSEGDQLPG